MVNGKGCWNTAEGCCSHWPTPIFRATFTGALKNLLDLVPVEGLMGKLCGLLAMGASDHHYLAVDTQLRPVLAWFGAHPVPGGVYLQSRQFQEGKLTRRGSLSSAVTADAGY